MIETWLDWPSAGVFAALVVLYGTTGTTIAWVAFGSPMSRRVRHLEGVVAPFFASVGILFALLTSFLAGDIGDRNRQAARAVQAEAAELRNVFTLSVAAASDMGDIRAAWGDYVKAVVKDDWPAMENGTQAASVNAAYDALLREVSDPRIATEAGPAVHVALLNAAVRVGTARSDRLALASDRTNDLKWAVVLILGVLTQAGIALVHLHKRNAQVAALTLFSVAVVITLTLIGLQERPFAGEVRVAPAPLLELQKLAAAP